MLIFFNKPKQSEDIEKARRNFYAMAECDLSRAIREYEDELHHARIIGHIDEPQYTAALIQLNKYLTEKGYDII